MQSVWRKKNTVLMANEKSAGVKYTFGIIEEAGRELLSYESYSIVNLIGEYQIKKNCGMTESDAVAYKVKTRGNILSGRCRLLPWKKLCCWRSGAEMGRKRNI